MRNGNLGLGVHIHPIHSQCVYQATYLWPSDVHERCSRSSQSSRPGYEKVVEPERWESGSHAHLLLDYCFSAVLIECSAGTTMLDISVAMLQTEMVVIQQQGRIHLDDAHVARALRQLLPVSTYVIVLKVFLCIRCENVSPTTYSGNPMYLQ